MMIRKFKYYAIIWAIALLLVNAVIFLVRPVIPGYNITYDARFWTAWVFMIAAFIGNLVCASAAFKEENINRFFYNVPLIRVSFTGLILMLIIGTVLMLIPNCPAWITAILCLVIFAVTVAAAVGAKAAADTVADTDSKVRAKTMFIRSLTADAESLISYAKTPEIKTACRKVYEAVRYSDPMSDAALAEAETSITLIFNVYSNAVRDNDETKALGAAKELLLLIEERNKKCRLLK